MLGNITDPYANHADIGISWVLDKAPENLFDLFICDAIIDGLTALVLAVAPELAEVDIFGDVELQSLCATGAENLSVAKCGKGTYIQAHSIHFHILWLESYFVV